VWVAVDPAEELVDLAWAPDDRHLIVVDRQPVTAGAARTSIHWLDTATGETQDLALLPCEVAPGSYVWSPDGQTVAFVVHTASLAAVCTLSVAGDFRYLGDLGHDGLAGPPVAPVAWAPDGRVLYGALVGQTQASTSNSSFPFSQNPAGLFLTDPAEAPGRSFSPTAALSPLWRPDGQILAVGLATGQETGLRLRTLSTQGEALDVGSIDLPAPGPTAYGVRWDLAHSRALVVTNRGAGDGPAHDYWLVDFGWSTSR
jgi:Tol biopolymer transport system component